MFVPYVVSWNLTGRCNLACDHCYMDAHARKSVTGELPRERALGVLAEIAELNRETILILTGGEPLMHDGLLEIARAATGYGMTVMVGSNGTLLDKERAAALADAGVSGVGVSIDSLNEQSHDRFRGMAGAWKSAVNGLLAARDNGLQIQVQFTPTTWNKHEIPFVAEWAHRLGAKVLNLFFLVCAGRGQDMSDISPQDYEQILQWAASSAGEYEGMMVRPKCAPHFKRILHQRDPEHPSLNAYIAACRAGTQYCRIDPAGNVTPCPYMPVIAGNLRESSFTEIWAHNPALATLRAPKYDGKCGACQYRLMCGGCRARAYAISGNDMGEDAWCIYSPSGVEPAITGADTVSKFVRPVSVADLPASGAEGLPFDDDAVAILKKIPFFARPIVQAAAEKYSRDRGLPAVTAEAIKACRVGKGFQNLGLTSTADTPDKKPVETNGAGDVTWTDSALEKVKKAPSFVRPGIMKLMPLRAKERGKNVITSEFVSEIRDESMMLVTKRMKKMGISALDMGAWDSVKSVFKSVKKRETMKEIARHLDSRAHANEGIMNKFEDYFADPALTAGWTEDAEQILAKAPVFVRGMAKKTIERRAKEMGFKVINAEAVREVMKHLPMGNFMAGAKHE